MSDPEDDRPTVTMLNVVKPVKLTDESPIVACQGLMEDSYDSSTR
jgi:hypothetical protein